MKEKSYSWNSGQIKALRRHMGLTQATMANELGTRQQTISEWEIGLYEPRGTSVKLLDIIAERSGFKYSTDPEK
jgi:DNA-binding transcriptional regulator YiaG